MATSPNVKNRVTKPDQTIFARLVALIRENAKAPDVSPMLRVEFHSDSLPCFPYNLPSNYGKNKASCENKPDECGEDSGDHISDTTGIPARAASLSFDLPGRSPAQTFVTDDHTPDTTR